MVLYICEKFQNNILNGFQFTEQTRVHGRNGYVQRTITPKVGKPELWFMCSARHPKVLYICVMLNENTERTRVNSRNGNFKYILCSNGHNSKSRLTRIMFFVFCTLSHGALHL